MQVIEEEKDSSNLIEDDIYTQAKDNDTNFYLNTSLS